MDLVRILKEKVSIRDGLSPFLFNLVANYFSILFFLSHDLINGLNLGVSYSHGRQTAIGPFIHIVNPPEKASSLKLKYSTTEG